MKVIPETKGRIMVLLVVVCQLLFTSCSKQLYSEPPVQNIKNNTGKEKLNDFMTGGVEKRINTRNASPDEIIKTAREYLGVPHCMGGTTRKCMDCSGLLVTVFARNIKGNTISGKNCYRSSEQSIHFQGCSPYNGERQGIPGRV